MPLCLNEPGLTRPFVIAPGNLLGGPNATLLFNFRERTEYDDYWRDYPRRRHIPAKDAGAPVAEIESINGAGPEGAQDGCCEHTPAGDVQKAAPEE
jgi:hypothetical protein